MARRSCSTVYGWYKSGKLPTPDAPHPHYPLWRVSTVTKWLEENGETVLTTVAGFATVSPRKRESRGEASVSDTKRSFGKSSLVIHLLHYESTGSVRTSTLPEPSRRDWKTGAPRWDANTIALWLHNNPDKLARVDDPDMLRLVSEVTARLGSSGRDDG
jgi:hypothetical protein